MKRPAQSYHPWQYSAARAAFRTGGCSVPNPTEDRVLKGFEPSAKGFATITNQSTQRPGLWKMADWLLSGWKGVTEIEIQSSNSISIRYCNSISLLSPFTPRRLQPGISFFHLPLHLYLISEKELILVTGGVMLLCCLRTKNTPLYQYQDNWNCIAINTTVDVSAASAFHMDCEFDKLP